MPRTAVRHSRGSRPAAHLDLVVSSSIVMPIRMFWRGSVPAAISTSMCPFSWPFSSLASSNLRMGWPFWSDM